jgi:hypothetical protein
MNDNAKKTFYEIHFYISVFIVDRQQIFSDFPKLSVQSFEKPAKRQMLSQRKIESFRRKRGSFEGDENLPTEAHVKWRRNF